MNNNQVSKRVYIKPEVEIMQLVLENQLLEASYPGDHNKGNHKDGPQEEQDNEAKQGVFSYNENDMPKLI
ncbi:hypothetical protein [Prevotella intermedia]|jgi:hypothetical protein|uniref:Uncharacterized protein n=1 Tax=Prevotella intermedia TaxID=28131 RepID=A0A2G8I9Z2_PREIN|nr:hypothetical protein [Prevotella intermedia]PIK20269.1 hypothetical protein CTI18_02420 [Prevotella intermedia]